MSTTVTVKTRIRVNGHDYASVDEMPAEVRQAYERALEGMSRAPRSMLGAGLPGSGSAATTARIVFNGQEYPSIGQMPADVRRLYDGVMATLNADETIHAQTVSAHPLAPSFEVGGTVRSESTGTRLIVAAAVIAAVLLASFVFGR